MPIFINSKLFSTSVVYTIYNVLYATTIEKLFYRSKKSWNFKQSSAIRTNNGIFLTK